MEEGRNMRIVREFTRIFKNEHNVDRVGHLVDDSHFVHHLRAQLLPALRGETSGSDDERGFPRLVVT